MPDIDGPGWPMCRRGWNRDGGTAFSIWRNNVGHRGVCRVCVTRAAAGMRPVPPEGVREALLEASEEAVEAMAAAVAGHRDRLRLERLADARQVLLDAVATAREAWRDP